MTAPQHAPATKNTPWWVYMVQTQSDKLYTGITTNLDRRFNEHCHDKSKQARFFRSDPAKALVYWQAQPDRSSASKLEAQLKKLTRMQKLKLVNDFQNSTVSSCP